MPYIDRRTLLGFMAALGSGSVLSEPAWPTQPVRFVVPFPAGGTTDMVAKLIAGELQKATQTAFVVDNRPGEGGNTGSAEVARAPGDGNTLLVGTVGTHAINASLYERLPYDPTKDFTAVSLLAEVPNVLVMNPDRAAALGVSDVASLVKWIQANPGQLRVASSGVGTSIHLCAELFAAMVGAPVRHVPFRGSNPAVADLLAGKVDAMFDNLPSSLAAIKQGKLKALVVTSGCQAWALMGVLPLRESGVEALRFYEATSWFGLFAPAATPRPVVGRIHQVVRDIIRTPSVRDSILAIGAVPGAMGPDGLARFASSETARWSRIVKKAGAKA
jgi:tripartite-type tricarboxylate transporter receptor subunit TctC